ncbi:unnamed protein product [Rotaria magnacalcarata]|uniref:Uncharacterized protein n=1 Tax=Rotaria magnacalcarata TaxID=392030 RepID=A0A816ZZP1_9BILA|nr:unnamed protein product [Rotaria magnacalcarata]CAF4139903.1 unnamed protein product [Rotaria magnacalcarata]
MARNTNYEVAHDLQKLAVIAVFFNPVRYSSRYNLYRRFEEHMSQSGVFLFTVECVFESAPLFGLQQQTYEVTQSNNPHHLQLVAPSILWMKENLINISVKHLPAHIEYIAWIDTDIEFDHLNWPHLVIEELQRYPIVQLFEMANFLGPKGKNEILRRDYSFVYSIKHNKPIDSRQYKEWYPHPGYAWAMRRTEFNSIGGLFEFAVLGSGDLHLAYALLNRIRETFPKNLHEDYQRLAIAWSERVAELAQEGHNVGYVPINIWHHWHGSKNDRGYVERWSILERHQFSPSKDLERNTETGVIGLVSRRNIGKLQMSVRMIALERDIVIYFQSRKEDSESNVVKPIKSIEPKPGPVNPKPTAAGSGSHFRINKQTLPKFSSHSNRPTYVVIPSSGYSHINDPESCWVDCTCCERHDHHHDNDCPCCTHYGGGHGWEDHHEKPECFDEFEHEQGCHDHNEEDEFYDAYSGDCDQGNTPGGNVTDDYGDGDHQGDTNDDGDGPGSFY